MQKGKCATAIVLIFLLMACQGQEKAPASTPNASDPQQKKVGGGCDGCELMFLGMPEQINSIDTSRGWYGPGQKLLVTGTVYQVDGKTPAPGVIVYYWQTDHKGLYSPGQGMAKGAERHGHIRGWIKTGADGHYAIYTNRPAAYPDRSEPAHIHLSVKEPGIANEYYTDELVFDDDQLLTGEKRRKLENRGGSGVLRLLLDGNLQIGEHNIILGLHIPYYPVQKMAEDGLDIGEDSPSFTPYHAYGPDKGTTACPVCKYGRYHGILYFVGNQPDWTKIKAWLSFLENESAARRKYLKVYFIYGNEKAYDKAAREKELFILGDELRLQHTALTFVPSLRDKISEVHLNRINPATSGTLVLYRNRNIIDKWIAPEPVAENFAVIRKALDRSANDFFQLNTGRHD